MIPALVLLASAATAQDYRFPTTTDHYGFFYVTAYYDQNRNAGQLGDWNCGSNTYDQHRGSDFGVGGFPGMDAGRDLVAAADGTVTYVEDGWYDRCTSGDCPGGGGFGNHVRILHADGKETVYAHMKQWSITVSQGQAVGCGDHLGQVGSSGFSTGPHLHFAPYSGGSPADPFAGGCSPSPGYWVQQGGYDPDSDGVNDGLPSITCEGGGPGGPITVALGPLRIGQDGAARVTDAIPGETVHVAWGTRAGPGPCPNGFGGTCFDIADPRLLGTGPADADGTAIMTKFVGGAYPIGTAIYVQAMVARGPGGADSVKSNVDQELVQ